MLSRKYTLNELSIAINEGKGEFNPRLGKNVEKDNKKNNSEAVEDILNKAKEYDGGITDKKKNTNSEDVVDYNKTTLDVNFASKPGKEYVERVKAQVHGFPSVDNEKNTKVEEDNESLDFEGNKEFYDNQKKKSNKISDEEAEMKHAGLKARMLPKEKFKPNNIFKENKTMKRLHFKNTVFLNESQMLKRVPDEFKTSNVKFIMKDAEGTEYLVESRYDEKFKHGKLVVLNRKNENEINEELSRIRELSNYNSSDYFKGTSSSTRSTENNSLNEMIDHVKDMEKNGVK